ncbi:MAG: ftsL 2 [Firmicutes bacterium]|nr:ftsL 2 [Bacillota bacterium]
MIQKNKTTRQFSWFRLCIMVMAGYFCYVFIGQQTELARIRQEAELVNTRMNEAVALNTSLTAEKEMLSTAAYIEKVAREQLGLVKPGEVPYIPSR